MQIWVTVLRLSRLGNPPVLIMFRDLLHYLTDPQPESAHRRKLYRFKKMIGKSLLPPFPYHSLLSRSRQRKLWDCQGSRGCAKQVAMCHQDDPQERRRPRTLRAERSRPARDSYLEGITTREYHRHARSLWNKTEIFHRIWIVCFLSRDVKNDQGRATGGELYDRLSKLGRFTESDASQIIFSILSGLSFVHKHDIIHRVCL